MAMSAEPMQRPSNRRPSLEPLEITFDRVLRNISERTGYPKTPTGIDALDSGCMGLHECHLTTIAARPGQGKSTLVCQIALELAKQKKKVCYLSLEMSKETVAEIMMSSYTKISRNSLMKGETEMLMREFPGFVEAVHGGDMHIIDDYGHTEQELFTLIEHLQYKPEFLIIDHLQQVRRNEKRQINTWEILTDYLCYLKTIAMRYKVCVICLSQINRSGEDKPSIANLKGTGGIEEISDEVLLCYKQFPKEGEKENYVIDLAKNRFGIVGKYNLFARLDQARFYNSYAEYLRL